MYKYRVVLQGSNVKDDGGNNVYFADTSSAPTNMICIRSVMSYGHLSGGETSRADAEQAFIQPLLDDSVHMFIFIPKELQTAEMIANSIGINNPVFRLRRPLYGWSRSGNIWEQHLASSLESIKYGKDSWKPVEHWPQTFWKIGNKGKVVMLTVYVDDFVLAGPASSEEWPSIRAVIRTSEPTQIGRVLGVHHNFTVTGTVTDTVIDMVDYVEQSVEMYNNAKGSTKWPLKENVHYPWYEPTQVEIDTLTLLPGEFQSCAASLLMKALYCARMVRLDICYTINTLSRYVTKWNALCDKQLRHLYSYMLTTSHSKLHGRVDTLDLDNVVLHGYPDADLAGTFDSTRATSGGFVEIVGDNTYFPLDWYSKRQTATSHSTTEAELVSASKMLRESLIPLQHLWSIMLQRSVVAVVHEDNMSTITVIQAGYSPQLRYINKHHRISLGITHEMCKQKDMRLEHCPTDKQKGDIATKGLARAKHEAACRMVGLYPLIIIGNYY